MDLRDVVVTIPTKRLPPVRTLESYVLPEGVEAFVIADPSVYKAHRRWLAQENVRRDENGKKPLRVRIVKGKEGLVPQVMMCYITARAYDYKFFFRLDDDLPPETFIMKDRSHPTLKKVMRWARQCIDETGTSLAGFCNTSRVDWIAAREAGYGRSYALVHGGAQLCRALDPWKMVDPTLPRYEDVWRSLSHRRRDGAVGRVKFVGLDKMPSQQGAVGGSSIKISEKKRKRAIRMIVAEFPEFVRYLGEKSVSNGKITYPKFQYVRHPGFRP